MTLEIDTMVATITDGCGNPNGSVVGFASGDATSLGLPTYFWENQPGTDSEIGTTWTNIPPGWYIFNVNVGLCVAIDSVYVGMDNPPVAQFIASPITGCNPIVVDIVNTSQNASSYYWDFGDGTTSTTTNMDPITMTYTQTATIQLIASQNANCTDLTFQLIEVANCGCTDPNASNYDPNANFDDGTCYFPFPTVISPNIFTPNADGNNDIFYLTTTNAVKVEMTIVNRWGNLMYEVSYDPNDFINSLLPGAGYGWTGTTPLGIPAEDGTYFVKYTVTGVNEDTVDGHGFLQLARH